MKPQLDLRQRFSGLLLGTAVGDSLGLPAEGLSRKRIERRWSGRWQHRFIFGRGMCSDDTEHTLFVAQALLAHPTDADAFQRCLAGKLRLWLLGIPAGVGLATLRAILKLWIGFPPTKSGVFSAGNGPAMRSAIIGAFFANDPDQRRNFVSAATRITHTDPKAEIAALAVAETAAEIVNDSPSTNDLLDRLQALTQDEEWRDLVTRMRNALSQQLSTLAFAESIGLGETVSGYAFHTVPVALYAWLRHQGDFETALTSALNCGGDTDTVGAITGALAGAACGEAAMPSDWLNRIWEWPRSRGFIRKIAARLSDQKESQQSLGPVPLFWSGLIPRNLLFLVTVLLHGFRRLAPPY